MVVPQHMDEKQLKGFDCLKINMLVPNLEPKVKFIESWKRLKGVLIRLR